MSAFARDRGPVDYGLPGSIRVRIAEEPDEEPDDADPALDKTEALQRCYDAAKEIRARAHEMIADEGLEPGEWYDLLIRQADAIEAVAAVVEKLPTKDELWSMMADWLVGHELAPNPVPSQAVPHS